MSTRIQGVLAKDERAAVWVCHRGGIGGGKKGVGPNLFWQEFPGKWVSVSGARVAQIGAIEAADFVQQVATFVNFVQQIKPKKAQKAAIP